LSLSRRRRWLPPGPLALSGALLVVGGTLILAVERLQIVGGSMRPTLEPGDRVLVLRFARPRAGDLVALRDPRKPERIVVKRVASVEGVALTVLGDNSDASTDSRHFGPVSRDLVRGRVVFRYAPEGRQSRLDRVNSSRTGR
jgi:nickel-type superoxide dismutase maturation protease